MGTLISPKPPFVSQGKAPLCWAACTTSWLAVNPDRPQLNLKQLVDRYGDPKKNGGISFQDAKYDLLRRDLGWTNTLAVDVVLRLDPSVRSKQLTLDDFSDFIGETLFTRGYFLLVDNHTPGSIISEGISHMYVVFGITAVDGGHEVFVMDPSSATKATKRQSVATFINHHIAVTGTDEKITPKQLKRITITDPDKP